MNGAYVTNLHEYESIGTYWIALYINTDNVTCLHSFGVEHIPKIKKNYIVNKNIATYIYRKLAYYSVMCKYLCIKLIRFVKKLRSKFIRLYHFVFSLQIWK